MPNQVKEPNSQGICPETILAVIREDKFDLAKFHPNEGRVLPCHCRDGKIGRREEENGVVSRFAASMWIHTKAVICNGRNHMQNYKLFRFCKFRSIMELANRVFDDPLDEHEWVSELTISCQEVKVLEALQYDLANPCTVQWRMV